MICKITKKPCDNPGGCYNCSIASTSIDDYFNNGGNEKYPLWEELGP